MARSYENLVKAQVNKVKSMHPVPVAEARQWLEGYLLASVNYGHLEPAKSYELMVSFDKQVAGYK